MISIRSIHQEFQFCWAYTRSIFSYIFPKYKLTSNKSCFPNHCRMCPGVRVVLWLEGISNFCIQKTLPPPENNIPWFPLKNGSLFSTHSFHFRGGAYHFPWRQTSESRPAAEAEMATEMMKRKAEKDQGVLGKLPLNSRRKTTKLVSVNGRCNIYVGNFHRMFYLRLGSLLTNPRVIQSWIFRGELPLPVG